MQNILPGLLRTRLPYLMRLLSLETGSGGFTWQMKSSWKRSSPNESQSLRATRNLQPLALPQKWFHQANQKWRIPYLIGSRGQNISLHRETFVESKVQHECKRRQLDFLFFWWWWGVFIGWGYSFLPSPNIPVQTIAAKHRGKGGIFFFFQQCSAAQQITHFSRLLCVGVAARPRGKEVCGEVE